LKENILYVTDKIPNANLFFHPWLFTYQENDGKFSLEKNPYIGIFHPYGSIFAHKNSEYLNKLVKTSQHYHHPQHFSPNKNHKLSSREKKHRIMLLINKLLKIDIDWSKKHYKLIK
jgi:hypothetical protein